MNVERERAAPARRWELAVGCRDSGTALLWAVAFCGGTELLRDLSTRGEEEETHTDASGRCGRRARTFELCASYALDLSWMDGSSCMMALLKAASALRSGVRVCIIAVAHQAMVRCSRTVRPE